MIVLKSVMSGSEMASSAYLITSQGDVLGWIESWQNFVNLGAEIVVPGHGGPTNYEEVTKYTVEYLRFLSDRIRELIENDGTLQDAYLIDQSSFDHLDTYFELARQNAGRVFRYMEFEF